MSVICRFSTTRLTIAKPRALVITETIAAILITVGAATTARAAAAISYPTSNCQVLISATQPDTTGSWSGPCVDGLANGPGRFVASDGTDISGDFRAGKPYNASGLEAIRFNWGGRSLTVVTVTLGQSYFSKAISFENPAKGKSCSLWTDYPDETTSWTGQCVNGAASGPGIASYFGAGVLKYTIEATFVDGRAPYKRKTSFVDGRIIDGEDKEDGRFFGYVKWPDGSFFNGEFRHMQPYNAKGSRLVMGSDGSITLRPTEFVEGREHLF